MKSVAAPRTGIHIIGAFALGVIMMVALYLIPLAGRARHLRRVELIQTGAATDLRLIATQEARFYKEHRYYTTDFNQLGIVPKAVLYKTGFVRESPPQPGTDPSIKDLDILKTHFPKLQIDYSSENKLDQIDISKLQNLCPDCTATQSHFRVLAAAHLDGADELDIWTIDDNGQILHVNPSVNANGSESRH
jgi:hypothetical protein